MIFQGNNASQESIILAFKLKKQVIILLFTNHYKQYSINKLCFALVIFQQKHIENRTKNRTKNCAL